MKTDLATSIVAVIAGIFIAYFVTNIIVPPIENVSFKTLDESIDSSLTEPNSEVFNFRAVNPTVEVYVGDCTNYDQDGKCIDDEYKTEEEEVPEEENKNGNSN